MMMRLGTRKSALAMAQAEIVCRQLIKCRPDLDVEVVGITTRGDRIQDVPLTAVGGKGLFLKEIEEALLDGRIDFAVHSMKDVPAQLARPFQIAAILERGNPLDAFVSTRFEEIDQLPHGARIGTSLSLVHISEPTRLRRNTYAVFCLKKKKEQTHSMIF